MPAEVAEHVRDCQACRSYITAWNSVELQFRSLRETWPNARECVVSPIRNDGAVYGREAMGPALWVPALRRLLSSPARAASVAVAVAAVVWLALFATSLIRTNSSIAGSGPTGRNLGVEAMDAIRRDAPVAATR